MRAIAQPGRSVVIAAALCVASGLAGCASEPAAAAASSWPSLRDPTTCAECHPSHFAEWSGSMHAYASIDPVFRAMVDRARRDAGSQTAAQCMRCHAPVAVMLGMTTDGAELADVPAWAQGVTCWYCHTATSVGALHDGTLHLAEDGGVRGGLSDPVPTPAHANVYSPLHDRSRLESAELCGGCHPDSFSEWGESLYSNPVAGQQLTCGSCHMDGRDARAAVPPGGEPTPIRRAHSHRVPAVDIALVPFPDAAAQRAAAQRLLDHTILPLLCVYPMALKTRVVVGLENIAAGHNWPSCSPRDRRAWVELVAYDANDEVLYETGVVDDGVPVTKTTPAPWILRYRLVTAAGDDAHFPWDAIGVEADLLPPQTAASPSDPRWLNPHIEQFYDLPPGVARVTMRVRLRPIGLEILDDLIASGDLDPTLKDRLPTYTLAGTVMEWSTTTSPPCVPDLRGSTATWR